VLVRNAHSIAASDDFFAFQKQIQKFFGLLEGVSGHRKLSEKELFQPESWHGNAVMHKTRRAQKLPTRARESLKYKNTIFYQ